jgi:protein SCO1
MKNAGFQIKYRTFFLCANAVGMILFLFSSCNPPTEPIPGEVGPGNLQRLMLYYPKDSLDASGNPTYHTIPSVDLISQDGKSFNTNSVKGKIAVVDFFFASCGGICPKMTSQLTRVQKQFGTEKSFAINSFTVDPERDSAAFLMDYAMMFKADTAQWKFITGPKKKLYDLARYGYFLPVEPGNGDSEDFIHSDQLVLIDQNAHIRGYYTGTDSAAVDSMMVDIRTLLNELK